MAMDLERELYRASARTFEDLAFILLSEGMPDELASRPLESAVVVRFKGPFNGRLALKTTAGVPASLAANMLGSDKTPPAREQLDALKETANVLCGNFLPAIAGPQEVFRLEAPEPVAAGAAFEKPSARVQLALENGRCEVEFYAEGMLP